MSLISKKLACAAAVAASLLFLVPQLASASNDGKLCDGPAGWVLCSSLMAIQALTPKTPDEKMRDAIMKGDIDRLQVLARDYPQDYQSGWLLAYAVPLYTQRRFAPAVSKETQLKIIHSLFESAPQDQKNQQVASLAHSYARMTAEENEMLEMAFSYGADASRVSVFWLIHGERPISEPTMRKAKILLDHGAPVNSTVDNYSRLPLLAAVEFDQIPLAELFLQYGANPDAPASMKDTSSGLLQLLGNCKRREVNKYFTQEQSDAEWDKCQDSMRAHIRFLVAHGADVNGRASPESGCITPYDRAKALNNQAAMDLLLELKADPSRGQACRSAAASPSAGAGAVQ
jgi:hypothetical protein